MALSEERKAGLLAYCRIDALEDGEEDLLEVIYAAAVGYMAQAGVCEPDAEDTERRAQYDLCVNAMVLDSWDSRWSASGPSVHLNPAFSGTLKQLQTSEEDDD